MKKNTVRFVVPTKFSQIRPSATAVPNESLSLIEKINEI